MGRRLPLSADVQRIVDFLSRTGLHTMSAWEAIGLFGGFATIPKPILPSELLPMVLGM